MARTANTSKMTPPPTGWFWIGDAVAELLSSMDGRAVRWHRADLDASVEGLEVA